MKVIIMAVILMISSAPAFSGSYPLKIGLIDRALSGGEIDNVEQVKMLRDKCGAFHMAGEHLGSVEILEKVMKLAGIEE